MSLDTDQIAEAFCSWRFAETYPYLADNIKWSIVGRAELRGRAAVIARCTEVAIFLATVSATMTQLKLTARSRVSLRKALPNFKIRKIRPQG